MISAAADHHPAAIVCPAGEADVQASVRFASEHALPVSVRSGGHHHAGYAVGEGALMIDLSSWRNVHVDAAAPTVTVQPGATWGELDAATMAHGLVTTGCDMPPVGVGGSVLGGGFGWLHRRFGLSCDNLLAARMVTADAAIRTVDAHDADGLFWALRGGGGAFGVVTELTLALHPVPALATTTALLPMEQARDGLAAYREITANAPEDLFARAVLMPAPPAPWVPVSLHGRPVLIVAGAWLGDPAGREAGLREVSALGSQPVRETSYIELQRIAERGYPGRVRALARSHLLDGLTDGLLDTLADAADQATGMWMIGLEPGGGAMARVAADATAFAHRHATHHLIIQSIAPADTTGQIDDEWLSEADARVRPHTTGAAYANTAMPRPGLDLPAAAYGPSLPRLTAIKAATDPADLFRFTPLSADPPADRVGSELLFANDRIRVWLMRLEPGETCAPHRHRHDYLMLYPEPAAGRSTSRPGVERLEAGFVAFATVGSQGLPPHQITNLGPAPATHYIIELLGPSAAATAQPPAHNGRIHMEPQALPGAIRKPGVHG